MSYTFLNSETINYENSIDIVSYYNVSMNVYKYQDIVDEIEKINLNDEICITSYYGIIKKEYNIKNYDNDKDIIYHIINLLLSSKSNLYKKYYIIFSLSEYLKLKYKKYFKFKSKISKLKYFFVLLKVKEIFRNLEIYKIPLKKQEINFKVTERYKNNVIVDSYIQRI